MERLVVWLVLAGIYGGILALLVQYLGQGGILVWLPLVYLGQMWLRRRARGY